MYCLWHFLPVGSSSEYSILCVGSLCIIYWCKYKNHEKCFCCVDDVFGIWVGTEKKLDGFLNYINSFYESIEFTTEIENPKSSSNFLHLGIRNSNDIINMNIYRKKYGCSHT